jgi:hypothetical protein
MIRSKNENTEKIFALAMALTPYPLLRVGLLGLPEVIIILLSVYVLFIYKLALPKRFLFSVTFVVFILTTLIGFFITTFLFVKYSLNPEFSFFNLGSFTIVLLACYDLEILISKDKISPLITLKYVFIYTSIILTFLFIISLFTNSFLGLPLKYLGTGRFCPLSENPHTAGLVITILPFIGLFFLQHSTKIKVKLFYLTMIILNIIIGFATGADKVPLAFALGFSAFFFTVVSNKKLTIGLFLLSTIVVVLLLNLDFIISYLSILFEGADGGNARSNLYIMAIELYALSPIFGLGSTPQVKLDGDYMDYHSTIFAILLSGGIIAFIVFSNLFIKLLKIYKNYIIFISLLASLSSYIVFSDVLRRPFVWSVLTLIYYFIILSERKKGFN